jgi:hypothetical protein
MRFRSDWQEREVADFNTTMRFAGDVHMTIGILDASWLRWV